MVEGLKRTAPNLGLLKTAHMPAHVGMQLAERLGIDLQRNAAHDQIQNPDQFPAVHIALAC